MRDVTFDNSIIYYINMDTDYLEHAVTMAMSLGLQGSEFDSLWGQFMETNVSNLCRVCNSVPPTEYLLIFWSPFLLVIG